jgi:membrane protein implicated in regulation of membrane protease activity
MINVYAWLVAALVFLILEMGHPGLFFWLSFSIGSCVAAGLTWYGLSWYLVLGSFLVTSLLAIGLLKYFVGSFIKQHETHHPTNTDALIGQIGIVVTAITGDQPGRVRVGSEVWMARAAHVGSIKEGARVTVVAVRGSHVVVKSATE